MKNKVMKIIITYEYKGLKMYGREEKSVPGSVKEFLSNPVKCL